MGWKEFAASVIGDLLDWPIVVLVIVLILLGPIRRLISRLKTAKGLGGELAFELEKLEKNTQRAVDEGTKAKKEWSLWPFRRKKQEPAPPAGTPDATSPAPPSAAAEQERPADAIPDEGFQDVLEPFRVENLIVSDPSGAVLGAWRKVETRVREFFKLALPEEDRARIIRHQLFLLRRAGIISSAFEESVLGLQKVRNEVAHGEAEVTSGSARTYVESAKTIEEILIRWIEAVAIARNLPEAKS